MFAATAADVTDVVVGGRLVVEHGHHTRIGDVGEALRCAIDALSDPAPSAARHHGRLAVHLVSKEPSL